jgi:hypothetical protein
VPLSAALQSRDTFPLPLEEALKLAARRCLVAAGAWEMLGHGPLASLQARKLLHCHGKEAGNLEVAMALAKAALGRLRGHAHGSVQDNTYSRGARWLMGGMVWHGIGWRGSVCVCQARRRAWR